jgi:hypothetical protein
VLRPPRPGHDQRSAMVGPDDQRSAMVGPDDQRSATAPELGATIRPRAVGDPVEIYLGAREGDN